MSWEITVNFDPANAPITTNQGQPGMGFYKVRCSGAEQFPYNDGKKPFVKLILTIIEAMHDTVEMGNSMRDRCNIPHDSQTPDAAAWSERFLKATLIGLGHDVDQVTTAKGGVKLGEAAFLDREGYVHYEPYVAGDKTTNSNVVWLTVEQYERGVAGNFKVPLKNKVSMSIDAPAAAATPPAGFAPTAQANTSFGGATSDTSNGSSGTGAALATLLG